MDAKEKLVSLLKNSERAVFFGGAGTSTASGIPDFRSSGGIFNRDFNGTLSPEEIVSANFFYSHTAEFYEFYKKKMLFPDARPNRAHEKLAELEKQGVIKAIVTQNIDGLHQAAGSKNVLELHGSAHRNHCLSCGKNFDLRYVCSSQGIPRCDECGGIIKPDVVLYGEALPDDVVEASIREIAEADLLIIGGTSLSVYPAASFAYAFKGSRLVVINRTPVGADSMAELVIRDDISEVFDF